MEIRDFNFTSDLKDVKVKEKKNKVKKEAFMSFKGEKREKIKLYILEKIADGQTDFVTKTAEAFETSLNTIYRYVRELEAENVIRKKDKRYVLVGNTELFRLERSKGEVSEEDVIYSKCIAKYIKELPDNVERIWQYSFMEIMNNAIDHSMAENVTMIVSQNILNTTILIMDNGIGIFKKIKEYYNYDSLDIAVNELFKGKLTTDSKNHSGEGIFFTSRILDRFAVISDGKVFTHDKYRENLKNLEDLKGLEQFDFRKGTTVHMQLSNNSKKNLKEVFDMFADDDGGFTKTRIPVKNFFETYPVSRSQAKRLSNRFEAFQEIELDFEGIDEIGQGFAHELFVVFQRNHKNINLVPIHTTKDIDKMINHVKSGE